MKTTTTTAEIIASNAAVSVDQRRDYPNAAAATAAYWTNVVDTCAEYRLPIPRGSRTRYLQEVAAEARRVADARRTAAMRRRAGHRAAVAELRKDLTAAVAAEESKFQAFKASRTTAATATTTTTTTSPALDALRAAAAILTAARAHYRQSAAMGSPSSAAALNAAGVAYLAALITARAAHPGANIIAI